MGFFVRWDPPGFVPGGIDVLPAGGFLYAVSSENLCAVEAHAIGEFAYGEQFFCGYLAIINPFYLFDEDVFYLLEGDVFWPGSEDQNEIHVVDELLVPSHRCESNCYSE